MIPNKEIDPKHLPAIWQIKTLSAQFDKVISDANIHKDLERLSFKKNKNVVTESLDFMTDTHRKYINCGKMVFFNAGFIFEKNEIFVYVDFYLKKKAPNFNREKATALKKLLSNQYVKSKEQYVNEKIDNNYRVIIRKSILNFIEKYPTSHIEEMTQWLKNRLQEIRGIEEEINSTINN